MCEEETITADAILVAEYEYVAQTAFQAHEDRARVSTFYLVALGSFVAAIYSSDNGIGRGSDATWAFAFFFFVLVLAGALTLLQLIRLREAWFESVEAMNHIKEYYQKNVEKVDLKDAFLWNKGTMPSKYKRGSVSFFLALQVALLGGIVMGGVIYYVGLNFWWYPLWQWIILGGVLYAVGQMLYYRNALNKQPKPKWKKS